MPEIGPMELLVIAVVALIVFGPEKLPGMARRAGAFLNDVRRMSTEVRSEITDAIRPDEDDYFDSEDETPGEPEYPKRRDKKPASEEKK
ncbi:MAG: Sec-independent protein translocase protein TatB [Actinomycetota bacterium]|nr:Sec-independent protein translocase protein TatB [Actinomycetota bacterium]